MPINLPSENIESHKLIHTNIISEELKKHYNKDQQEKSPPRKKSRGADREEEMEATGGDQEGEEDMSEQEMPDLEDITEDEAILDMHLNRTDTIADASLYNTLIITKDNTVTKLQPKQLRKFFQQGKVKYARTERTTIPNKIIEQLILKEKMECGEGNIMLSLIHI